MIGDEFPLLACSKNRSFPRIMLRLFSPSLILFILSAATAADPTVKVFVLAGQSNMQGHGRVAAEEERNQGKGSLEWLAKREGGEPKFQSLIDEEGNWIARDDVQIHYLDRSGDLAPGFGAREGLIGPELGFGRVIGDALDEPVLLIKIAWGGKSLGVDFRPPSSGGETGTYYRDLVRLTKESLQTAKERFPQYKEHELELVGFGWHQGWNDRVNQKLNDEYEENMANFIRDIRRDLGVKDLPFVIAETGMSGRTETHPRALSLMKAQAAAAKRPEFRGNVAFVGTRDFFRPREESPSGQAYHWNSNAETYYLIGEAMGNAMLELMGSDESSSQQPSNVQVSSED